MMIAVFVFVLIFSLATGTIFAIQYRDQNLTKSCEYAFVSANSVANIIDGDKIEGYLETGITDAHYEQVLSYMESVIEYANVEYFYVYVPMDEYMLCVWDSYNERAGSPWELGHKEPYEEGEKEELDESMEGFITQEFSGEVSISDGKYGYLATAIAPVFDSDGNISAIVAADVKPENATDETIFFMIQYMVFALVIAAITTGIYLLFINKKIVKPINTLHFATKEMIGHLSSEETMEINVKTNNELQELAEAFMQMNEEVKRHIRELYHVTAEKERIGAELNIATQIQLSMLPNVFPPYPERHEFEIYATTTPAKEVGGDFYDFFMIDERHLAVVIADVSGKGVPAALFMVIGKTLIKDHTKADCDLGEIFEEVNNLLCESNSEEMFITAFEGVLDLVTGEFRYVNAGHDAPYISRGGKGFEQQAVKSGLVLAAMEGMTYQADSIMLEPGDKVFLYTDGVVEAVNEEYELFAADRLKRSLDEAADENVYDILPKVKKDLDDFVGEAAQFDDITMLCIAFQEKMTENELQTEE